MRLCSTDAKAALPIGTWQTALASAANPANRRFARNSAAALSTLTADANAAPIRARQDGQMSCFQAIERSEHAGCRMRLRRNLDAGQGPRQKAKPVVLRIAQQPIPIFQAAQCLVVVSNLRKGFAPAQQGRTGTDETAPHQIGKT